MRKLLLIIGMSVFVLWFGVGGVGAKGKDKEGVVWFRRELFDKPDKSYDRGACWEMSLNENVVAKVRGEVGPGCDFTVDVEAVGEWVFVGGYFNTPPYSWVQDKFYLTDKGGPFSFTCSEPVYGLDPAGLPGYVQLVKEEPLPGEIPVKAAGKRYYFTTAADAPTEGSFNLGLGFTATCEMRLEGYGALTPVEVDRESGKCGEKKPIEINPRGAGLVLPVTINENCTLPPATATPTEAPPTSMPTATPEPTNTPVPTNTPIPTATPTPRAVRPPCHCDSTEIVGPTDPNRIKRGETLTFRTTAYVDNPAAAKVDYMVYRLALSGQPVNLPATPNPRVTATEIAGRLGYYETTWSYRIPDNAATGAYRVDVGIRCRWKNTAQVGGVAGAQEEVRDVGPAPRGVQGSVFGRFVQWLRGLFGVETQEGITVRPPEGSSPKLGTFDPFAPTATPTPTLTPTPVPTATPTPIPPLPPKGCTYLYFRVVE